MRKTQNFGLFGSHVLWSHNLETEKSEITPDTTRVQTCSSTNTTFINNIHIVLQELTGRPEWY